MNSLIRTFQRYAIPRFVSSIIWFFKNGVKVSMSSRVQLSTNIRFGKNSVVKPYSIIQTSGGKISFGSNCAISSFNHIATGQRDIVAGNHVRTAPNVTIVGTTRIYRDKNRTIEEQGYADRGITIGNDVLIGSGAVLLDGCEIGDGAVIGAGSVVTGRVAPYSVVVGVPAKVIKWRE